MIQKTTTLRELLQSSPDIIFVLQRFDISLDSPDRTLEDCCKNNGIDPDFYLLILQLYNQNPSVKAADFTPFSLEIIIDFLIKTHQFFTFRRMNEIEQTFINLSLNYPETQVLFQFLTQYFNTYKSHLKGHFGLEEKLLFPYLIELEKANNSSDNMNKKPSFSIETFEEQHNDIIEQKLSELVAILEDKYSKFSHINEFRVLITQLKSFERDLNIHAFIEDNVLLEKAKKLELTLVNEREQ